VLDHHGVQALEDFPDRLVKLHLAGVAPDDFFVDRNEALMQRWHGTAPSLHERQLASRPLIVEDRPARHPNILIPRERTIMTRITRSATSLARSPVTVRSPATARPDTATARGHTATAPGRLGDLWPGAWSGTGSRAPPAPSSGSRPWSARAPGAAAVEPPGLG